MSTTARVIRNFLEKPRVDCLVQRFPGADLHSLRADFKGIGFGVVD